MVNRQLTYIFSAVLILTVGSMLMFFVGIILYDTSEPKVENPGKYISPVEGPASINGYDGQMLFMRKCASCHNIFKDMTGPALQPAFAGDRWDDRKKLYEWIRYPASFMKKDPYTRKLKDIYGSMMTGFPDLEDEQIEAIVVYVISTSQPVYHAVPAASQ